MKSDRDYLTDILTPGTLLTNGTKKIRMTKKALKIFGNICCKKN